MGVITPGDEIPDAERGDMVGAYQRRLTGTDEAAKTSAARAWSHWETTTKALYPPGGQEAQDEDPEDFKAVAMARIENHCELLSLVLDHRKSVPICCRPTPPSRALPSSAANVVGVTGR